MSANNECLYYFWLVRKELLVSSPTIFFLRRNGYDTIRAWFLAITCMVTWEDEWMAIKNIYLKLTNSRSRYLRMSHFEVFYGSTIT